MIKNLEHQIRTGLSWDLMASFLRQIVTLLITIILARLLTPKEFGIVGMALVFINVTQVFIDIGFTNGIIQRKSINKIVYSSVFYINTSISIFLSLIIYLIAPFVGDFYGESEVGRILKFLAIIPVIGAFGQIQKAIIIKKMDFKSLSIIDVISTISGGVAGIIAAHNNKGVYSLVIVQLLTVLTSSALLWSLSKWRPKLEFSTSEIKSLMGFSSYVFFDQVSREIFNKIDTIYIGKVFSPTVLGFYSRAESLKAQINTYSSGSLRKIMFPAFSSLQDQEKTFKEVYKKSFNLVTGLVVLIVGPLYFLSEDIIIGLFGEKWRPSIIFFQILIFTTLTTPHVNIMAQAILARGYSKLKFKIGLIQRLFKLSPIAIGFWFGDIIYFCYAIVVSTTLVFVIYSFAVFKKLDISFILQMRNFVIPNILFLLTLVPFNYYSHINTWLFTMSFIFLHILYIKILKHESYLLILQTLSKFRKPSSN